MDRLNLEIIDQIDSIIADIQDMKNAIPKLKTKLNDIALKISSIPYETRLEVASYLYWMYPEIHTKTIAQATIGEPNVHKLLKAISPVTASITCNNCGQEITITSRAKLSDTIIWRKHILCEDCKEKENSERIAASEAYDKQKENRFYQLKTMPYNEYLQTPEWQERKKRHLKTAGFSCQVCNGSGDTIDVHHRTYERRGEEYFKDLIALCRGCHELYHRENKLPKME